MTSKEQYLNETKTIKAPINRPEIQTDKGGDYTGRCYKCGSYDLWDDNSAYGCNTCGMIRCTG